MLETKSEILSTKFYISFVRTAENAQSQVTKGTVLGGHLGVVQRYLVYKFITVNVENQTGYITLIDAETAMNFTPPSVNNKLVRSLNPIFGHQRLHGFGGGQGSWKICEWKMWH
jgi:hypothetical protein